MPLSLIMLISSIVVSTASTSGLPLWVNSSRFASPFFAVQGMTATWYTSRPSLFFVMVDARSTAANISIGDLQEEMWRRSSGR